MMDVMKKQRQARRKIIRQWTALPSDKRQSVEQIAAFAKMAVQQNEGAFVHSRRNAGDFESAIDGFARGANEGLIVASSSLAETHRDLLLGLVARHKLPAIYSLEIFVKDGGLMSYSPSMVRRCRQEAGGDGARR